MGYAGNDINYIDNVASAEACGKLCQEDGQCLFWTYQTDSTVCNIKTSDSGRTAAADRISGQKPCQ